MLKIFGVILVCIFVVFILFLLLAIWCGMRLNKDCDESVNNLQQKENNCKNITDEKDK